MVHAVNSIARSVSSSVYAADWAGSGCIVNDVATIQCLEPLFENVVRSVLALAGVALFIMLIVGGFTFLTSSGDPKKLEQARHTVTYALIGIAIMAIAYLILRMIASFTGVHTILEFTIPDWR